MTFIGEFRGIHERLRTSEGLTAAFDRGFATLITTVALGDPENPLDDVLIDQQIIQHGPTRGGRGFTLFCEVVTEVLR